MVCSKCEAKLAKLAAPDAWKEGSRNVAGGRDGGRVVGENKALSSSRRFSPYSCKCTVCRQSLHQQGLYCQTCAYAKGVCSMCGVQILDTAMYKMSGGGDPAAAAKRREAAEALAADVPPPAEAASAPADVAPALRKLSAPGGSARVAAGTHASSALALACSGAAALGAFQPAAAFSGSRPGYSFGTGAQGTGYYADEEQRRLASAHAASVPQAVVGAAQAAQQLAASALPMRTDPSSLASAALQRATLVGGTLSSSLGAAGRALRKPAEGGPPPGWLYDEASGYYADVVSQQYYDPRTQLYFDCAAGTWAAEAKAQPPAAKPKRVVDRWGL